MPFRTRSLIQLMPLLAFSLLFTACSQEEERDAAQGVYDHEIVLGTHLDLSGPIVSTGTGLRDGMLMALEDINRAGGVHGRALRLVAEDTGYEPSRAVIASRKLLARDKIFAIITPLGSPTVAATMTQILKKGVLHLFPLTALEATYAPFHRLKFSAYTPYKIAFKPLLKLMVEERGLTRPAILYQDDDFGYDVFQATQSLLKENYGLEFAAVTTYKRGATDFSSQMARLKAANPDFLIFGTIIRETVGAARVAYEMNWNVPIICSIGCWAREVPELGGRIVEGIYATARLPMPYADDPNPKMRRWYARYQKRFGMRPNGQSVEGYIHMRLFAEALRRAGPKPTQEKVARALEDMPPWRDPDLGGAPLDYTRHDHQGSKTVHVAQIQNRRWRILTPNPLQSCEGVC